MERVGISRTAALGTEERARHVETHLLKEKEAFAAFGGTLVGYFRHVRECEASERGTRILHEQSFGRSFSKLCAHELKRRTKLERAGRRVVSVAGDKVNKALSDPGD